MRKKNRQAGKPREREKERKVMMTKMMMEEDDGDQKEQQQAAGLGILLQISMLALSFILGHILRRKKIYLLPEASASLLIGLLVGALALLSNTQTSIR